MHNYVIRSILLIFLWTASGICQTLDNTTLYGTFVDAEDGHPIPEVLVRVAAEKIERVYPDQAFAHATATDTKGTFLLTIPNESQFTTLSHSWHSIHSIKRNAYARRCPQKT